MPQRACTPYGSTLPCEWGLVGKERGRSPRRGDAVQAESGRKVNTKTNNGNRHHPIIDKLEPCIPMSEKMGNPKVSTL